MSDVATERSGAAPVADLAAARAARYGGSAETGRPPTAMPPLEMGPPYLSVFEFWNSWQFYPPIIAWFVLQGLVRGSLTLSTLANPGIYAGGVVGESKAEVLDLCGPEARKWVAPYVWVDRVADLGASIDAALTRIAEAGLPWPLVAKPDLGCRGAGVRLLADPPELAAYLEKFPVGLRLVLQRYCAAEGEAGVGYQRYPDQERGRIFSLTLKYFPYVIGDGRSTLRQLILADPRAGRLPHIYLPRHEGRLDEVLPAGRHYRLSFAGNHSKGAIFRNGAPWITDALARRFDEITRDIPGFFMGRFDVRFADFEAFRRGEDLTIIEINGAGGEATHIWDSRMTLLGAWRDVCAQVTDMYRIGAANRKRGHKPMKLRPFLAAIWQHYRLTPQMPETE